MRNDKIIIDYLIYNQRYIYKYLNFNNFKFKYLKNFKFKITQNTARVVKSERPRLSFEIEFFSLASRQRCDIALTCAITFSRTFV